MSDQAPRLQVEGLETGYGSLPVARGVSFAVGSNEILALIGANGAGKSTTLNAIVGRLPLWGGRVTLDGRPISGLPAHRVVAAGVALVPEGRHVFTEMTVEENLLLGAHTRRDDGVADDLVRWFDFFPQLAERRRQAAGSLSGGEQQMLAIARALMARPRVLLMDEPSLGLAPKIVASLFQIVPHIRDQGIAIVLVEQNARLALDVSDRALVMQRGRIVLEGASARLAADPRVRGIYLGHTSQELPEHASPPSSA